MGSELRISVSLRPTAACRRLTDTLSPCGDVIGQCRMQDRCSTLLFWAVWDSDSTDCFVCMRLFGFAALCGASCYVRSVLRLIVFFSLCGRIFLCCLRSFALARATSPCQSPRAGPQRFLVWVRVCGCCALELKKQNPWGCPHHVEV